MAKAHIERRQRDILRIKEQIQQAARKLAPKKWVARRIDSQNCRDH